MINTSKTEIAIYNDKVYLNFEQNKKPNYNKECAYLSVILLDVMFVNLNKQYYPQILLG